MFVYLIEGWLAKHFALAESDYRTPQAAAEAVRHAVRDNRLWDIEEWDDDGKGLTLKHIAGMIASGPVTHAILWVDTGMADGQRTWLKKVKVVG